MSQYVCTVANKKMTKMENTGMLVHFYSAIARARVDQQRFRGLKDASTGTVFVFECK